MKDVRSLTVQAAAGLLFFTASVASAPQRPASSGEMASRVLQYTGGLPDDAIGALARLDEADVLKLSLPPDADARTLAAAALLHTEAGIRNGSYNRRQKDRPIKIGGDPSILGAHFAKARSHIEELVRLTPRQSWVEEFVVEWLVATVSIGSRQAGELGAMNADLTDQSRRWFPDNGHLALLGGFKAERWMGPEKAGPGSALSFVPHYRSDEAFEALATGKSVPGLVSTSHGKFSRNALQEAESLFRRALRIDVSLVAARVRLGRLLYLSDRPKEAVTELERGLKDASSANNAVVAYWAALQLGLVHEQLDDRSAAAEAYRVALKIHPNGRSAHLALGALELRRGGPHAPMHALASMGTVGTDGRGDLDPWVLYPYLDYWRLPSLLSSMRATLGIKGEV